MKKSLKNPRKRNFSEVVQNDQTLTTEVALQKDTKTLNKDEYLQLITDVTQSLMKPVYTRANIQDMFKVVERIETEELTHFQKQIESGEKILKTINDFKKMINFSEA